jgi:hypothetical protein
LLALLAVIRCCCNSNHALQMAGDEQSLENMLRECEIVSAI